MPKHNPHGQQTDTENSKAVPSVSRPGDDNKSLSLGSFKSLATSSRTGIQPKGADQTFQKVPSGI